MRSGGASSLVWGEMRMLTKREIVTPAVDVRWTEKENWASPSGRRRWPCVIHPHSSISSTRAKLHEFKD